MCLEHKVWGDRRKVMGGVDKEAPYPFINDLRRMVCSVAEYVMRHAHRLMHLKPANSGIESNHRKLHLACGTHSCNYMFTGFLLNPSSLQEEHCC